MPAHVTDLIAPVAMLALGAAALVYHALALRRALSSLAWPVAPGEITRVHTAGGVSGFPRSGRPIQFLTATLRYRYRVGRRWYEGDRIHLMEDTIVQAVRTTRRYQEGQPVEVRYDPGDFTRAVLLPGPTRYGLLLLVLSGLCALAGGAATVWVALHGRLS
jgi:hypothetical protein